MNHWILTPAYGRDYRSADAARVDFVANRDFYLHDGLRMTFINREQIPPGTRINIRYAQLRRVAVGVVGVKGW